MCTYDNFMSLVDQIAEGENGAKEAQLKAHCRRFLLYVRNRFCFHAVPYEVVVNELVDEALSEAFIARIDRPKRFLQDLQNAFRKRCRRYLKHRDQQKLAKLWHDIFEHGTAKYYAMTKTDHADVTGGIEAEEETAAAVERQKSIAVKLLGEEEPECQKMILMKCRGASDSEIAATMGISAQECKRTRQNNIRRMRRRVGEIT